MIHTHTVSRLKRNLLAYSSIGTLAISVTVAIVSGLPLFLHFRGAQEKWLLEEAQKRAITIEEYLNRAVEVARQVAGRTTIRAKLMAYNREELSLSELAEISRPSLGDALNYSPNIAGISCFAANGQMVVQVGVPVPRSVWSL